MQATLDGFTTVTEADDTDYVFVKQGSAWVKMTRANFTDGLGGDSLPSSTDGQILVSNAGTYASVTLSGGATIDNTGAVTLSTTAMQSALAATFAAASHTHDGAAIVSGAINGVELGTTAPAAVTGTTGTFTQVNVGSAQITSSGTTTIINGYLRVANNTGVTTSIGIITIMSGGVGYGAFLQGGYAGLKSYRSAGYVEGVRVAQTSGYVSIGDAFDASARLHVKEPSATTNDAIEVARFEAQTTGTAAAGLAASATGYVEVDGTAQFGGSLDYAIIDAGALSYVIGPKLYGSDIGTKTFIIGGYPDSSNGAGPYVADTDAYYFGAPSSSGWPDGTWRIIRSGNDLKYQRRESGSWVDKSTIAA